ncbi:MAG: hypothetical protein EXR59_01355 [Dehalococcoidia bacterium]|nr:hypothetical protein [Dehalococcoidia bacterium]
MAVADSTSLITAAKLDCLYLLREVTGPLIIGPASFEWVIKRGVEVSAKEVSYIRSALDGGWLQMVRLSRGEQDLAEQLARSTGLHRSEAEALALAKDKRQRLIADDKEVRGMARAMGVQCVGMPGVITEALATNRIRLEAFEDLVVRLADITWLSPSVVAGMLTHRTW